jgi:membrane protein YdbS with pleckstrin-like domain
MAFPTRLLIPGEELVLDLKPHPVALFFPALMTVVGLILAGWLSTFDSLPTWIPWAAFLVLLLVYVVPRFLNWYTSVFAVTSDRVVHRYGWISKFSMEIPLEAINDVRFEQGVIDRVVGAGSLLISSASTTGTNRFEDIRHPEEVQKTIYHQGELNKQRMYQGLGHGQATPAPPAPAQPPPAQPAPGPAGVPSTTTELERLARLRADGVLTEEEFQAQKAKILGQG